MGGRAVVAGLARVHGGPSSSLGGDVERLGPGRQRRTDGRHVAIRRSRGHVLVMVGGVGPKDESRKGGRGWRKCHMTRWREGLV